MAKAMPLAELLAMVPEVFTQRPCAGFSQHSSELRITSKIRREIITVFIPQGSDQCVASLVANFAVRVSAPAIQPIIAMLVTHTASKA
jgi:hypothetical protein